MIGADLPEELITDILTRLPVKSLLKFRCVSKWWLSLISNPQFAKTHLKNVNDALIFGSTSSPTSIYTCPINSVSDLNTDLVYSIDDEIENPVIHGSVQLDCPFFGTVEYRFLVGSCNGLVCLSFSDRTIILWNPITKKSRKLPVSDTHISPTRKIIGTNHGFGYDSVNDDYKVVEFNRMPFNAEINVYSRRSDSWKALTGWPGGEAQVWPGQFLNGAIHWSVYDSGRDPLWFLVAQDLAHDVFVEMPIPDFEEDDLVSFNVRILGGCLAVWFGYYTFMDVWVMKEYAVGESWNKVVCIPYFLDFWEHRFDQPYPLLFLGDGGKILINYGRSLRVYDTSNLRPHQFCDDHNNSEGAMMITFSESLVSPNYLDEEEDVSTSTTKANRGA